MSRFVPGTLTEIGCGREQCRAHHGRLEASPFFDDFMAGQELDTREEVLPLRCDHCNHLTIITRDGSALRIVAPADWCGFAWEDLTAGRLYFRCTPVDQCGLIIFVPTDLAEELLSSGEETAIYCPHCYRMHVWEKRIWKQSIRRRSHPIASEDNVYADGYYEHIRKLYADTNQTAKV